MKRSVVLPLALAVLAPPLAAQARSWPPNSMDRPKPPVVTPGRISHSG